VFMSDAKSLYLKILPLLESRPEPVTKTRLKQHWAEIEMMAKRVKKTTGNEYAADSCWEALIFCIERVAYWASQPLFTDPSVGAPEKSAMHLIFRGQSNQRWGLQATFWRDGVDRNYWDNYQAAFCRMLKFAYEKCIRLPLPAWVFQAAAQHYRVLTTLLDWTTDPAMAIWFGARPDRPTKDQRARVFCIPTHNISRAFDQPDSRGVVILPPPFVENLFVQRGLFTHVPEGHNEDLRARCLFEITFPQDEQYSVIREDKDVDVEKTPDWMAKLKDWAKDCADRGERFDGEIATVEEALGKELARLGTADFLDRKNAETLAEQWRERTEEMLRRIAHFESDDHEAIQDVLFADVVCDNSRFMEKLANHFQDQADKAAAKDKAGFQQYADRIRNALSKCKEADDSFERGGNGKASHS
jgi:FRG domain